MKTGTMVKTSLRKPSFKPCLETLEERCLLNGGGDVTSTAGLIAAINAANSSGSPTTITLASGTAFGFTTVNNQPTNGSNALPVITGNITIVGNGDTLERTTGSVAFRFFDVANGGSLTLQNLILQGGLAEGQGAAADGGAIFSSGALLNLNGVTVQNSEAEATSGNAFGGGIYYDGGGSVFLSHDYINTNEAVGGSASFGLNGGTRISGIGGGVCVYGASGVALANDTFNDNEAIGGSGGGVSYGTAQGGGLFVLNSTTTPTISHDNFNGNKAIGGKGGGGSNGLTANGFGNGYGGPGGSGGTAQGGGLFVSNSTTTPTISLDNFNDNEAIGGNGGIGGDGDYGGRGGPGGTAQGGGLFVSNGTTTPIIFLDNNFSANKAIGGNGGNGGTAIAPGSGGGGGNAQGGGLFVDGSNLTVNGSSISNNAAEGGNGGNGGISTVGYPNGTDGGNGGSYGPQMYGYAITFTPFNLTLPPGSVGTLYATQTISATLASSLVSAPTLSYNLTSSPLGLNFSASGNQLTISGTPTAAGTVTFTVTATDSDGSTQPLDYTLTINIAPAHIPSPTPSRPPALNVPPLLAFFDSLLGGVETVNANGTETITGYFIGFPLLVASFDSSGDLVSVDLFGFDVTFLFG